MPDAAPSPRQRLPNRRECHTETLAVDGQSFEATVGFDPESGQPRELFMAVGKEGSLLNAMLADAAVVINVALQHGVPADLEGPRPGRTPASPIGAALDLLRRFEDIPID